MPDVRLARRVDRGAAALRRAEKGPGRMFGTSVEQIGAVGLHVELDSQQRELRGAAIAFAAARVTVVRLRAAKSKTGAVDVNPWA